MHNKDDRTCWRAWMTADQARDCAADSHPELTIHPVSHAVRLPPNFLRSTVGFTSEDESPVGRTAPMLTLDLCPTAAAGELVAFAKRVEGELYDLFAAVPDAGDAAEASHARHTDSFFWTSQAAEPHKTGAPHTTRYARVLISLTLAHPVFDGIDHKGSNNEQLGKVKFMKLSLLKEQGRKRRRT